MVVDRAAGWTDGLWATRVRTGDALEVAIGEERADGIPTPVIVTLEPGHALGVVGPADAAAAVASAIVVRLAVDVGPADLTIVTDPSADAGGPDDRQRGRWSWLAWLPHLDLADDDGPQAAPATLLVVDDPRTLQVRTGAARRRMAAGATAVVVAREVGELPHVCNVVVEVDRDGRASVRDGRGRHVEDVVVAGLAADVAMQAARHLAGYHDPEVLDGTSRLPDSVDLVALTGPGALSERAAGDHLAGPARPHAAGRRRPDRRRHRGARPRRATAPMHWWQEPPDRARASCCGRSWRRWRSVRARRT